MSLSLGPVSRLFFFTSGPGWLDPHWSTHGVEEGPRDRIKDNCLAAKKRERSDVNDIGPQRTVQRTLLRTIKAAGHLVN